MSKKQKKILIRIFMSASMLIMASLLPIYGWLKIIIFILPYLVIGYDILLDAFRGIINRQIFDENFLMAVASIGAFVLGDCAEGVLVILFYQIGELFQSYAVGKSRKNIANLMDIRPDYANIEENGQLIKKDPEEIEIGTVITVQPGEKIPLDGEVCDGTTTLDTSALTGESMPRQVTVGDQVISGCINTTDTVRIKTTKEFGQSTVSKILELVENSTAKKSKSEQFITKFAKFYTPVVCLSALALAILPPLLCLILGLPPMWGEWIYRGLTFLVISCPCALVISIPLSFFAGLGGASKQGILIKGSNYMETLSKVKCVVFDKTGTMTEGIFSVTDIHHCKIDQSRLLELVALAESHSSHPIAKSLMTAYGKIPDRSRVSNVKEISGQGVITTVDGIQVAAGNKKLMKSLGVQPLECNCVGTVVYIALDGEYAGHIVIADKIKKNAFSAVAELKKNGILQTVMLTGDSRETAETVARDIGVDVVHSQLLPGDKVDIVETLLGKMSKNDKLIFVGDGINDAPVLSRADVGIAMGGLGSDAAIEAADVVLMDDDPGKIPLSIKISKKCLRIVHENIIFALGIKFICLILGALGIANLWLAIFADVGVMVLAVLNAMRALLVKNIK